MGKDTGIASDAVQSCSERLFFAPPMHVMRRHFVGLVNTASSPTVLAESSGEESVELRQHRRYRLSAPVSFSWESREGAVGTGEGHTRDISIAGVFVLTPDLIPEGSLVRMDVNLPPVTAKSQPVHLRSQGHVPKTMASQLSPPLAFGCTFTVCRRQRKWYDHRAQEPKITRKRSDAMR